MKVNKFVTDISLVQFVMLCLQDEEIMSTLGNIKRNLIQVIEQEFDLMCRGKEAKF